MLSQVGELCVRSIVESEGIQGNQHYQGGKALVAPYFKGGLALGFTLRFPWTKHKQSWNTLQDYQPKVLETWHLEDFRFGIASLFRATSH